MCGMQSTSTPSSGASFFMLGCGQSVPHSTRSGNFSTSGLGERHDVVVGRTGDRHPLRACHLDPEVLVLVHQPVEALVLRVIDALLHVRRAHVIDHDRGRQRGEEGFEVGQVRHLEIDHDVPAERRHPRGDPLQHLARGEIDQAAHEVEAHAAHPRPVHGLELGVGDLLAHEGDALGLVAGGFERIDHRPIVLAVAGRLHDHVLVEPEEIAQREQLFLGRVAGRVFALGRVGKFRLRAEHVAVRIDRARRRPVFRLRRVGMERDVACAHRHGVRLQKSVSTPAQAPARRPARRRRTWWRARAWCRSASSDGSR